MNDICKFIPVVAVISCVGLGIQQNASQENTVGKSDIVKTYSSISSINTTTAVTTENTINTTTTTKIADVQTLSNSYEISYADWSKLNNYFPCLDSYETIYVDPEIQDYIKLVSCEFGVPYELSLAVCYAESEFNPYIDNTGLNSDGTTDYGMMGLNSLYLQSNCDIYNNGVMIDPYNPYENIYIGVQILAYNYNYFCGNIYDTANAYNLGAYGWESLKYSGQNWYYGQKIIDYINLLYTYTY